MSVPEPLVLPRGGSAPLVKETRAVSLVDRWIATRQALREAQQLGLKVRISGAGVVFSGNEALPSALQDHLNRERHLIWCYLGAEDADLAAVEFADTLGVDIVLVETVAEARRAVRQLIRDTWEGAARNTDTAAGGHIGIDIETAPKPGRGQRGPWARLRADGGVAAIQPETKDRTGLDPHQSDIQVLQLYAGGRCCFVLRHAARDLVLYSHWLRRQRLVAHNAGFELGFIRYSTQQNFRPPPQRRARFRLDCSMQATGLLLGVEFGGGRSLANASKQFLGLEVPKELQVSDWAAPTLSPGQLAYAASDAILAWRLWSLLIDRLCRSERWAAYELQRGAIPAVVIMELRGLGIDLAEHRRQSEAWSAELAEARCEYQALTGDAPPTKPAEVQAWLARVLDAEALASWPRTASGQLSTKDTHLKRLIHIPSCRPVLTMLAKARLISTFGPKLAEMVNPVTGRLHASFNISGAKSGRFSCAHPNLQQLPNSKAPEFKRCIVPAPGNLLVGCDWNQVELRAAAWISGDRALTQLYEDGRDLHAENAALIAGVSLVEVTREQRQGAKAVSFGALYGMQAAGLVEYAFDAYGIEMDTRDAERALDRFFRNYPQLDRWRWDNWHECQRRQQISIGAGRVVEAAWEFGGNLRFTQCCNLPIQGVCADAMLRALQLLHTRLRAAKIEGGLIASVHDELLLEVRDSHAEATREILQQTMVDAFILTFPGAPLTNVAVASVGCSWAELKG